MFPEQEDEFSESYVAELRGLLSGTRHKEEVSLQRLEEHLDRHPSFVSFSGGKDSLVALDMALRIDKNIPVCFFSSDLDFPENVQYVHELQESMSFTLEVIPAPVELLWIFQQIGWYNHYQDARDINIDIFDSKIAVPSNTAHKKYGNGRIWGMRADESKGRSVLLRKGRGQTLYKDGKIAFSPVWNWKTDDIWGYIHRNGLPINPLYTKMKKLGVPETDQRVGSVFDGSNTESGRLQWLKRGWPDIYENLKNTLPRLEEYT